MRALAVALAVALPLAGCEWPASAPEPAPDSVRAAPATLQGGVIVEPPELGIGETATVEIAIVTPPDHRVAPLAPPDTLEGLWVLSAETLPVRREPGRLVHRTRFLVRTRATGDFVWPAQQAEIETPTGAHVPLALAARPLRVVSAAREWPERTAPFTYREPREPGRVRGFLLPAAFGALAALAAVALTALARRARGARAGPSPQQPTGEGLAAAPARAAQAALGAALERVGEDPVAAAGAASVALRGFVERATGVPATRATTEELAARAAPLLLERRWPEWLALLGELDGARFRARALELPTERAALAARLQAGLELVARTPGAST